MQKQLHSLSPIFQISNILLISWTHETMLFASLVKWWVSPKWLLAQEVIWSPRFKFALVLIQF